MLVLLLFVGVDGFIVDVLLVLGFFFEVVIFVDELGVIELVLCEGCLV